jgi:vitamin B12/bleomycin/antimicrobial peptide transport system ATP-binding/permease protein
MKSLSVGLVLLGLLALVRSLMLADLSGAFFSVVVLLCAFTTFRSASISSFLKIFIAFFSVETIVFGLAWLADRAGFWPPEFAQYAPPTSLPVAVAVFSIIGYAVTRFGSIAQIMRIADRYFDAADTSRIRIFSFRTFRTLERRIAVTMIVFLVVLSQFEVGVTLRLNFFNRDFFDAIQHHDAPAFWHQLLIVFVPWVVIYVALKVAEFFMQAILVIRWRRWLTDYFVKRWLADHNHYRISLVARDTDNPDQRIAEDIFRFINGGSDGSITAYGIYDFSILMISTVSSLVSFAIVLWNLSRSFALPGTDIAVPGFLFWAAMIYAIVGTLIVHLIGRPLMRLYFERQQMEANLRFSLARLREYTEQIALLGGEDAERHMIRRNFEALIDNFLMLVYRRTRVTAFTETFGQISPIIPLVLTAPFYFIGKIEFGVMTQTAAAFALVTNAMTFFVNYYTYLAGFKSVVDRLSSFDAAIDKAESLKNAGPQHIAVVGGAREITLGDLDIALPNGRRIVEAKHLVLAGGQNVALSGPSGSGKSTLFRVIKGIWPYGDGQIRTPSDIRMMVVPTRPYFPISTLRAAVTYPAVAGTYPDEAIRKAIVDAHLGDLVDELDQVDVWSQRLSSGEQQRLALARVFLRRPDWLFLDEATAAVEEDLEAELYAMLARRLPGATIMTIGHHAAVVALHKRHLEMVRENNRFTLRDAGMSA